MRISGRSVPKMDEDAPEIAIVFLNAMVQRPNMRLIEKAQDMLLELPAAFTRDDLNQFNFPINGFFHNPIQFCIDLLATVVDIMQVKFKFCH